MELRDQFEERRRRARVKISLPVRIRQVGPPWESVEVTETLDVSRNGMRIAGKERYYEFTNVWVTMPYHDGDNATTPEFPASIVRVDKKSSERTHVAIRFHSHRSDPCEPRPTSSFAERIR